MNTFLCLRYMLVVWVLTILFFPAPTLAEAEGEKDHRVPLAMEVFLKQPDQHLYELHIHLTNTSEAPVFVDVRDLPWNPTDGPTWLSAVRLDAPRSLIKQDAPHGRFGSRLVKLLPGESIQDRMPLNPRIPSLLDDIAQFGVQLQWECPPASLKFVCLSDASNTITIPKGNPGPPDTYDIDRQACLSLEQRIGLIDIPKGHDVLFLLAPESVMADLDTMQSLLLQVDTYVQQCHPRWTNSWAVSFFTDKKYAGFLSEGENKRYFKAGLWQEANIGQYSSQLRTLFRFPWIKKRTDTVYLSLHRLQQDGIS